MNGSAIRGFINRRVIDTGSRRLPQLLAFGVILAILSGCERPPTDTIQRGYRGVAQGLVYNPRIVKDQEAANAIPVALPQLPGGGPAAGSVFKNVQVLGNLSTGEFTRTMLAMTSWVAPKQGCAYCHNTANMASDELYTKVVARRMLQMTQHINADWKTHVAATGVTCYTCHRGEPVPANIWFTDPGPETADEAGNHGGQNMPSPATGYTSLPYDPFTTFLDSSTADANDIRVISNTALPSGDRKSIKQTEWTYALMMHMSESLGVNCTYCHNSRSFASWEASAPPRVTAWYGIRMVRDLNHSYLDPLSSTFPPVRHGPLGDNPKLNCATCHQGVYKPLFGNSMLKDYPQFAGPIAAPVATPDASPASAPGNAPATPATTRSDDDSVMAKDKPKPS
jgi:photosynthetic reaction center cytochrome c subunit